MDSFFLFTEKKKKTPFKSITKYKIGQVVTVTVTQTTDKGILCHTDDNVKGFAIHDHLTGTCQFDHCLIKSPSSNVYMLIE